MFRGVSVFAFFALATVLVILLQPGPRAYDESAALAPSNTAASRNDVSVLQTPTAADRLSAAPSDVPNAVTEAPHSRPAGSLDRLNAALNASLGRQQPAMQANPQPMLAEHSASAGMVATRSDVAPDLRDMSWHTLSALNQLGVGAKTPGQEGSLLQSIVRRSMTALDGKPAPAQAANNIPVSSAATLQVNAQTNTQARSASLLGSYTVSSGDTLALIAVKLYGSAQATDELLSMNPVLRQNPNSLRIGQVLAYAVR